MQCLHCQVRFFSVMRVALCKNHLDELPLFEVRFFSVMRLALCKSLSDELPVLEVFVVSQVPLRKSLLDELLVLIAILFAVYYTCRNAANVMFDWALTLNAWLNTHLTPILCKYPISRS
jgi:hypothetical protein